MTTLGVIVPCRNEAAVIERKLRNFARLEWPASAVPHRIVVVDDGSEDSTARLAEALAPSFEGSGARLDVVPNRVRPGKTGAIEQGLWTLGSSVELVALTDADVVLAPDALVELARAFARDPRLGLATGRQTFVESLAGDGSARAEDGGPLRTRDGFYDRFATFMRRAESLAGLVFSVHGQLLAWRRELELAPTAHLAADDLDLMLQARVQRRRVELVPGARFFEQRPPTRGERDRQRLRRARAFVQFLRHPRLPELEASGSWLARAQVRRYVRAGRPGAGWATIPLGLIVAAGLWAGYSAALVLTAVSAAVGLPVWILMRQVRSRVEAAEFLEACSPMGDRWDTARR